MSQSEATSPQPPLDAEVEQVVELFAAATPGEWFIREQPRGTGFFIQAPRLDPDDPYDIEILGEDDTLYPTRRADAQAIVAMQSLLRRRGPEVLAAVRAARGPTPEQQADERALLQEMVSAYEDASGGDRLPDGDGMDQQIMRALLDVVRANAQAAGMISIQLEFSPNRPCPVPYGP